MKKILKILLALLIAIAMILLPMSAMGVTITVPAGSVITTPAPNVVRVAVANGTAVTMPAMNNIVVADNGNGTLTVTLPGESPINIVSSGGDWYVVFFNSNGGSQVATRILESGTTIARPTNPTLTGQIFVNWYSNSTLTNVWNFDTSTVTGITTLYARWTPQQTGDGGIFIPPPIEEPPAEESPEEDEPYEEEEPDEEEIEEDEPTEEEMSDEEEAYEDTSDEELDETEQDDTYEDSQVSDTEFEESSDESENSTDDISDEDNEELQDDEDEEIEPTIVTFTFANFDNPTTGNIANFRIISLPALGLQFLSGEIPAFTRGDGLFYTVTYRTNLNNSFRVMASNISASAPFSLLPPGLTDNEIITEIILAFDSVPGGFGMGDTIAYSFMVLDENNTANNWSVMFGEASRRPFLISAISSDINELLNRQNSFDAETWEHLQYVINYVQIILDNPNSTTEEIEMAYALLQETINELNSVSSIRYIIIAAFIFVLFVSLIFVLIKFWKHHKKRIASRRV